MNLEIALDVIRMANENHRDERGSGSAYLAYIVLNKGGSESSYTPNPSYFPSTEKFTEWCLAELEKGEGRKIPTRSLFDGKLYGGTDLPIMGEEFDPTQLGDMWSDNWLVIQGAFLQFGYNQQFQK